MNILRDAIRYIKALYMYGLSGRFKLNTHLHCFLKKMYVRTFMSLLTYIILIRFSLNPGSAAVTSAFLNTAFYINLVVYMQNPCYYVVLIFMIKKYFYLRTTSLGLFFYSFDIRMPLKPIETNCRD